MIEQCIVIPYDMLLHMKNTTQRVTGRRGTDDETSQHKGIIACYGAGEMQVAVIIVKFIISSL